VSDYYRRDGTLTTREEGWSLLGDRNGERRVAKDVVVLSDGKKVEVSTVHLVIDHNFGEGPPLIFETMVFGGAFDEEQERYSTEEEAAEGHARWLARVQTSAEDPQSRADMTSSRDE